MVRHRSSNRRELATVLFTDIVGSTVLATKLGDQRWRQLQAAHHAIIRSALRRFGGREIDTAGDGFLSTFERPMNAVECASVIVSAVRTIGLEVRAGIHTGEIERSGKTVGGIAVHIGSRVASQASAGEVLVSSTVRDLVSGSGFRFVDRGVTTLKGVDGTWHIFVFAAHEQLSAVATEIAESVRRRLPIPDAQDEGAPPPVLRRTSRRVLVAAGVAVVVAAAIGIAVATRDNGSTVPAVNTVVAIDPRNGSIRTVLAVGEGPSSIAAAGRQVWVAAFEGHSVTRIDADETRVIGTISGLTLPSGIAVGDGRVWVTDLVTDSTYIIDERTGTRTGSFDELPGAEGIAFGFDSLWVSSSTRGTLLRIDPASGDVIASINVGPVPLGVTVGRDAVWVASSIDRKVTRVDPATNRVVSRVALCCEPAEVQAAGTAIFVTSPAQNTLIKIDAVTNVVAKSVVVGSGPFGVASNGRDVWVANSGDGTIWRLDAETLAVEYRRSLGGSVRSMTLARGLLWVGVRSF